MFANIFHTEIEIIILDKPNFKIKGRKTCLEYVVEKSDVVEMILATRKVCKHKHHNKRDKYLS